MQLSMHDHTSSRPAAPCTARGHRAQAFLRVAAAAGAAVTLLLGASGCKATPGGAPAFGAPHAGPTPLHAEVPAVAANDQLSHGESRMLSSHPAGSTADADGEITLSSPAMVGPLTGNPHPMRLDAGELGALYVTGAASGLGMLQDHEGPGDHGSQTDTSNAQVIVQKPEGVFQFYAQAGAYSLPALGTTYVRADDAADAFYGTVPAAFVKFAPSESFSVMAGKLPTLFGAESTFTFENMNVERGLLWNQENAINRGVQANYAHGPAAFSVSLNDGFYSDEYTWLTGAATYMLDGGDSLCFYGGGNFDEDSTSTLATPLAQNNSRIAGLIYSRTDGPWTISPYVQYTRVPENSSIGIADDASTRGAAMLARYAFDERFSLAARIECIDSTGGSTSPSLLYGPGSSAWSMTLTPTWQFERFFVRPEVSYVRAADTTDGSALGPGLTADSQVRALVEVGVLF